jgi:hypothetical protein
LVIAGGDLDSMLLLTPMRRRVGDYSLDASEKTKTVSQYRERSGASRFRSPPVAARISKKGTLWRARLITIILPPPVQQ